MKHYLKLRRPKVYRGRLDRRPGDPARMLPAVLVDWPQHGVPVLLLLRHSAGCGTQIIASSDFSIVFAEANMNSRSSGVLPRVHPLISIFLEVVLS